MAKTLGELAGEIQGVGEIVNMASLLVKPNEKACNGSSPTQETIDAVFYSIMNTLDRIAEDLYGLDLAQAKAGTR